MGNQFWDLESGEMVFSLSEDSLMDYDGNLLHRMSDNMAMDYNSGEIHLISSFGSHWDDDDDD